MARTVIDVTDIDVGGVASATPDAGIADGHKFLNGGEDVFLLVVQSSGGPLTITIPTPATLEGGEIAIDDAELACVSGTTYRIGPFRNQYFLQSDGYVWINYESESESEFSVSAYRLPDVS